MATQDTILLAEHGPIPKFDQLDHLILGSEEEEPKDVVLFGEGNFTFSIALASLRKNGSKGMTITCFGEVLPNFEEAKQKNKEYCRYNGERLDPKSIDEAIKANIEAVSVVPDFSDTWLENVDATSIPDDLVVAGKVVWFQCPWTLDSTPHVPIQGYMKEMDRKQAKGDYLLIGITTNEEFIGNYRLETIFGDGQGREAIFGYKFLGGDRNLIDRILRRGYRHKTILKEFDDLHNVLIGRYLTLVFKKI